MPVLNPDNESNSRDYVLLNRWTVRSFNVHRGDIVSLVSPRDPEQLIIKRVIALEGDTIRTISWKHRYVNIPQGHCWVEGDHLEKSMDSNVFGPVALGLITAKASHIVWPPQRWQKLVNHIPTGRTPTRGLYSQLQPEFVEMQNLLNADEDEI